MGLKIVHINITKDSGLRDRVLAKMKSQIKKKLYKAPLSRGVENEGHKG